MDNKNPLSYVPGPDPEAVRANQAYDDALNKLIESLDARKNRLFDPVLLAMAEGFLGPTKTGSFGEALGRAAGSVRTAEEAQAKEEQEMAQTRLQLAGMGLQQQQLKSREKAFDVAQGLPGVAATAPSGMTTPAGGAAPVAGAGAAPATPAAPPGFGGVPGVPLMPPNPRVATASTYLAAARSDPKKSAADAIKEAQDIEQKRYQTKEGGVLDLATGLFYAFPKGELVERQIYGNTYKVPAASAAMLDLYQSTNDPKYHDIANRTVSGVPRPAAAPGAGGAPGATEAEPSTALKSTRQQEVEREESVVRAKKLAEAAATKEAELESRDAAARRMYSNASQVQDLVNKSPQAFGILNRPGLLSAVGNLVAKGMQTPTGTISMAGFEDSVRQAMPGITQADLNNVMMAAGALAEVELAYTQLYMAKQGAITEGEREVVRRIGGNISQSPQVLQQKAKLIQMRSQFDMDVAEGFRQYQEKNPNGTYLQYEKSPLYRGIRKDFETDLAKSFGGSAAVPTTQRGGVRDNAAAASRLDNALGGQR
jgi:hypothetical protein